MLPQSHAFLAIGLQKWLRSRRPGFPDADYRQIALAAVLPDLIDKPLAVFVFPELNAGLLFAHAPIFHVALWALAAGRRELRPFALAYTGHIIADRIWFFGDTFWFPLRGFRFHQWQHIGDPRAFSKAYIDLFKRRPDLFVYEIGSLAVFIWFLVSAGLTNRRALWQFICSGKIPSRTPQSP
jgi:hypothetical protein